MKEICEIRRGPSVKLDAVDARGFACATGVLVGVLGGEKVGPRVRVELSRCVGYPFLRRFRWQVRW